MSMEKLIMNEDFTKPFIKSLAVVAFVTIFAMVSSRYMVYYYFPSFQNTSSYTSAPPENTEK